jgi:glutamine---fructose-6-phosphate transaminase (isomerizing)
VPIAESSPLVAGARFSAEISSQPTCLEQQIAPLQDALSAAVESFNKVNPLFGLIAARGSSDNAARYAQVLFGVRHQLAVGLATPSLVTAYKTPPSLTRALVLGISQSGASPDVVAVVADATRQHAVSLAITNTVDSALAKAAAHVLPMFAGPERAVAASKTYTSSIFALAQLSARLSGSDETREQIRSLPQAVQKTLELADGSTLNAMVDAIDSAGGLLVVGRGYDLATAFEIALKLKETTGVHAEAMSTADLLHGPIAISNAYLPVLIVSTGEALLSDANETIDKMNARGLPTMVITDNAALAAKSRLSFLLPAKLPDWLQPIAAVVPGQCLALKVALSRGLNPDAPVGLSKVTLTY